MKKAVLTAAALLILPHNTVCAAENDNSAKNGLKYEISNGQATITGGTKSVSALVIPSEIDGLPVTAIANDAFAGNTAIKECVLPDSIKTVGARAFSTCPNLTSLSIGKNLSFIGDYAFTACPELSAIDVNSANPTYSTVNGSLYKNGGDLLLYAGGADAVISGKTTSVCKGAFFGRTDIVSVELPESVTSVGENAFAGCLSLKSVDIPDSVTTLGKGCFMSCNSIESVCLGKSVTALPDNCFYSCTSLNSINLPESASTVGNEAFYGCTALSGVYIPSSVTAFGNDSLGRRYSVRSSSSENITGFVITGKKGSSAEKYAAGYGIAFKAVTFSKGDVNGDGFIDAVDASVVLNEYSRLSSGKPSKFDTEHKKVSDWNGDSITDAVDASGILKKYAELSSAE